MTVSLKANRTARTSGAKAWSRLRCRNFLEREQSLGKITLAFTQSDEKCGDLLHLGLVDSPRLC